MKRQKGNWRKTHVAENASGRTKALTKVHSFQSFPKFQSLQTPNTSVLPYNEGRIKDGIERFEPDMASLLSD
jgi:hypothetical protein